MQYKIFNVEDKVYAMGCKHFDCSDKKCFQSFLFAVMLNPQKQIVRV